VEIACAVAEVEDDSVAVCFFGALIYFSRDNVVEMMLWKPEYASYHWLLLREIPLVQL